MTMFLQNRTISMILTVPDVKELISPLSHSVENLDKKSYSFIKNHKPPSIPIYHGSIIRIEQHHDNENTSDLIVRVPNFHHLLSPSVTISTNNDQLNETESQRIKRRAPICPILNDSSNQSPSKTNESEINSCLTNPKRLAIGLRNLSRAFITNCKSKRSSNINEITIIPVLPDVEVITENIKSPILSKKNTKKQNLTSKFLPTKILFIKQKHFKIKRKQPSSDSMNTQIDIADNTKENARININLKNNKIEQKNQTTPIKLNLVEQQSTTIAQLIPNIPISRIDPESSSTHPYYKISRLPPKEKIDLTTNIKSSVHIDNKQTQHSDDNIEEKLYIVHPNGDTYSESYEVTFEFDPEYQHFFDHEKQQIYLPEIEDQSSFKFNIDPFEYQDLTSTLTTWFPIFPINTSEQVKHDNIEQTRQKDIKRVKFHSLEDLSQTNNNQISTYQPESTSIFSSLQENNQILCLNNTPIINEDYTVMIQFLKRILQTDSTINDDYNEFNKQIDQLFQTDKINELEQK